MNLKDYFSSILSLSAGNGVAQLLSLLFLPIITRLYSEEEYGEYSIFLQLSILISIFIALRKENTFLLIGKYENILHFYRSTEKILILALLILFLLGLMFYESDYGYVTNVLLAACSLVLIGLNSNILIFREKYIHVGISEILNKSIFLLLAFSFYKFFGVNGLIYGYVVALIFKFLYLRLKNLSINKKFIKPSDEQINVVKKSGHSVAISHLLLSLTTLIPMFTINNYFSAEQLGLYALAIGVVFLPSSIISVNIGNIYFEKIIKNKKDTIDILGQTVLIAGCMSFIIFVPIFLFGPYIFATVFGSNWYEAGEIAKIISISGFFGFVTSTIDRTCLVNKNNLHGPLWHGSRVLGNIIVCYGTIIYGLSIESFLWITTFVWTALYLADFLFQIKYAKEIYRKS